MTVDVRYSVNLSEAPLAANDDLEGRIFIAYGTQPEIVMEDEFLASIQNLCFRPIPDLLNGRSFDVPYFSYFGNLRLDVQGENIVVSGDHVPSATFPRRELILALYDCGQRFIAFFHHYLELFPDFKYRSDYLEQFADTARAALQNSGYVGS